MKDTLLRDKPTTKQKLGIFTTFQLRYTVPLLVFLQISQVTDLVLARQRDAVAI